MRLPTTIAASGIAFMLAAGAAQALPAAPTSPGAPTLPSAPASEGAMVQPAIDAGPAPTLELVRGGCGFGEHRSYYGRCHYNHGWRGYRRYRRNHWRWHRYYY